MQDHYAPPTASVELPYPALPDLSRPSRIALRSISVSMALFAMSFAALGIFGYSVTDSSNIFRRGVGLGFVGYGLLVLAASISIYRQVRWAAFALAALTGTPFVVLLAFAPSGVIRIVTIGVFLVSFAGSLLSIWLLSPARATHEA